jgi:hypothetical protein
MSGKRCFLAVMAMVLVLTGVSFAGEGKAKKKGGGAAATTASGIQKRDRLKDGSCVTTTVAAQPLSTATKTRDQLRDGSCLTPAP